METELKIFTVKEICEGFWYSKQDEKGLFGLNGKLTIQPEYQRHYIYNKGGKDVAVIKSLLKKYPIGVFYFHKTGADTYAVLDGQQRITSIGRFMTNKLDIIDESGKNQKIGSLSVEERKLLENTKLLCYICKGTENDIKEWFETVNIVGVPLNQQERNNAAYYGPFVTKAKAVFSNAKNPTMQIWQSYVKGDVRRQEILQTALRWVGKNDDVTIYMSQHRNNGDISEMKDYFESVIDWVSGTFDDVYDEMQNVDWGRLYEKYHNIPYNHEEISRRVRELMEDPCVESPSGIFEYVLEGEQDTKLLKIRVFNDVVKRSVYQQQKAEALVAGHSNCPMCVKENGANKARIWSPKEMEADHVKAWSLGGATDIKNCQMLCKTHNRIKGNR